MITPLNPAYFILRELRALRRQLRSAAREAVGATGDGMNDAMEMIEQRIRKWEKLK